MEKRALDLDRFNDLASTWMKSHSKMATLMWFWTPTDQRGHEWRALGLAALYVLATILTQASHDHHLGDGREIPSALEGCDDPGSHWAGHTHTPDLNAAPDSCPACQQRAEHAICLHTQPADFTTPSMSHVEADLVSLTPNFISAYSCRGPPSV